MTIFARRRQALLKAMAEKPLEGLLVSSQENRFYLSGFTGSNGHLIITPNRAALVTDGRYWSQVAEQCPDLELVKLNLDEHKTLGRATAAWLRLQNLPSLGIEGRHMTVLDFEQLQKDAEGIALQPVDGLIEPLRQRKDRSELDLLRRAAHTADRALRRTLEKFQAGMTEADFCQELEHNLQACGARKPSFDTIVASGPNGAYPHAGVTDRTIETGQLITVDFGAYRDNYCSDMTRTIWLGGLDPFQQKVYQTVRKAHAAAIAAVRPGILAKELDAVARNIITEAGWGEAFSHSLGHGVGLAVHELPYLRSTIETPLEVGMVITIEPGIYLAGQTGCRVEDTVVVTDKGCELITHFPYQELNQDHPLDTVTG